MFMGRTVLVFVLAAALIGLVAFTAVDATVLETSLPVPTTAVAAGAVPAVSTTTTATTAGSRAGSSTATAAPRGASTTAPASSAQPVTSATATSAGPTTTDGANPAPATEGSGQGTTATQPNSSQPAPPPSGQTSVSVTTGPSPGDTTVPTTMPPTTPPTAAPGRCTPADPGGTVLARIDINPGTGSSRPEVFVEIGSLGATTAVAIFTEVDCSPVEVSAANGASAAFLVGSEDGAVDLLLCDGGLAEVHGLSDDGNRFDVERVRYQLDGTVLREVERTSSVMTNAALQALAAQSCLH